MLKKIPLYWAVGVIVISSIVVAVMGGIFLAGQIAVHWRGCLIALAAILIPAVVGWGVAQDIK